MKARSHHWDIEGRKYAIALTNDEKAFVGAVDLRMWRDPLYSVPSFD